MAYPFGGHPTVGQYIQWARESHGFSAQSGYAPSSKGKPYYMTRVYKDGGASIILPYSQMERLTPTVIGNLDKRLGLKSPWFSITSNE